MGDNYIGEIRLLPYMRGAPEGWQICDGSLLSIAGYEVLYQLLGTTYGGDGQNTFAVPDLRGRVPVHAGSGPGLTPRPLGSVGGAESVTLSIPQMGAHNHFVLASTNAAVANNPVNTMLAAASAAFYNLTPDQATPIAFPANTLGPSGTGAPHDNTAPTLTLQYCIAWQGIYPTPQ